MNAVGTNTAISTAEIAMIGLVTSLMACLAASIGDRPRAMLRSTFSTTTIASSTTMPMAAIPMGLTDFSSVGNADWVGLAAPFHFGAPQFPVAAVISMCVVMLVTFTESTADMLAVGDMTGRPLTKADLARGLAGDGLSGVFGGIMNGFVDTAFAQNVGLVGMTRVRSRYVAAVAGGILVPARVIAMSSS